MAEPLPWANKKNKKIEGLPMGVIRPPSKANTYHFFFSTMGLFDHPIPAKGVA
jgi:hypothetical protein